MRKTLVLIFLISIIVSSCKREFGTYYDRPLGQKMIYSQLAEDKDKRFTTFLTAVDKVPGMKKDLNSSGLYTVMAPVNDAFTEFFDGHPRYKSLDDVPLDTLTLLVKYHVLKYLFFQVNFYNPGLAKNEYKNFKYETRADLVSSEIDNKGKLRNLFYPSKLVNVYTTNFFTLFGVSEQDYADVYGTGSTVPAQSGFNVNGAACTEPDISSGNGSIHIINKVLMPLPTIAQNIYSDSEYSRLGSIMRKQFAKYTYNGVATKAQGNNGDVNGDGLVDSLWNRSYSFNSYLDSENPVVGADNISLSAFIPSKAAFDAYMDNKLIPGFKNSIDSIPGRTFSLLYQAFFSQAAWWPSKVGTGVISNLLGEKVSLTRSDINKISMAGNGIFYETKNVIEPKAFSGVTGPAFLDLKYWYFGEMLIRSGLLPALAKEGIKYTIFCPTNAGFQKQGISYDPVLKTFTSFIPPAVVATPIPSAKLASLAGNHIITDIDMTTGTIADGFYQTMNKSIIVIEGGRLYGYFQDTAAIASVNVANSDKQGFNGHFHEINKAIINPQLSLYEIINATSLYSASTPVRPEYTKFREMVLAAGLMFKDFQATTNVDGDKKFTLFVPSNEAIANAQEADLLPRTGEATGGGTLPLAGVDNAGKLSNVANRARLADWVRFFLVQQQVFGNGTVTGKMFTSRQDALSTPTDLVYVPVSVTYSGGAVNITSVDASPVTGNVIMSDKISYPYNVIAKDGIIHIIDNAFTSKY